MVSHDVMVSPQNGDTRSEPASRPLGDAIGLVEGRRKPNVSPGPAQI